MAVQANPPPYGTLVNQIYQQSYASIVWLGAVIANPSATPASLASQATLVLDTLLNGVETIGGLSIQTGVLYDMPLLQGVASLPINATAQAAFAMNNRITGLGALQVYLKATLPTSVTGVASTLLGAGNPAIPDINLLGGFGAWTGEPIPAGYGPGTLTQNAVLNQGYWASIVSGTASYYGNYPQPTLDATVRAAQGALSTSTILSQLAIADALQSVITPAQVWNTCYALPASIQAARLVSPSLNLNADQISMATRYFLITMAEQIAGFVVLARGLAASATGNPAAAVITQSGQGLMDIASQNLGNFESWTQLTGAVPAPWGAGAIPAGTSISLSSGSIGLTQAQLLGTDLNFGSQNQPIPSWSGDFQINVGLSNFKSSLGRRLATTLGNLIYHPEYGSRIPPELGQILTTGGQSLITAYGKAALLADPRTQSILSATTTTLTGQPNAVQFLANVQPIGPGLQAVNVNEVLTPI